MCPTATCTAPAIVTSELRERTWSLAACYQAANERRAGQVVIEFEIGDGGVVIGAIGRGLGSVGDCAAKVVAEIEFPQLEVGTHVRYPLAFKPSA